MKLDLGCGQKPIDGFVGVDLPPTHREPDEQFDEERPLQPRIDARGIVRFDLVSGIPWPFADESVEELFSSHLVEHLPASDIAVYSWGRGGLGQPCLHRQGMQDALFWFLDEAWRVTQPGGKFLLRWPSLEDFHTGELQLAAFQDPTHRRFIPVAQIAYWSREGRKGLAVEQYRVSCDWTLAPLEVEGQIVPHLCQRALGGGPKPILETEVCLEKKTP